MQQNLYAPKFTYIIPFRYRQDRIIPLRRVIDWVSGFHGAEVIVVEQDKHSKISHLNLKCKHIFIENKNAFNKSWSCNVGIKMSTSSILLFGDADYVMNPNDLIESIKQLETNDCILPTKSTVYLTIEESMVDMSHIISNKRDGEIKPNMCDGISIFKKDSLIKIGGWCEDFSEVNSINKFQDVKTSTLLKYKQMDYTGYRLFNHKDNSDSIIESKNNEIINFHKDNIDKLKEHINIVSYKVGNLNKFRS
jgi:hypothetical protein